MENESFIKRGANQFGSQLIIIFQEERPINWPETDSMQDISSEHKQPTLTIKPRWFKVKRQLPRRMVELHKNQCKNQKETDEPLQIK